MKRQLFLDQDNFLADFSGGFLTRFGISEEEVSKDEMWALIFSVPDFFLQLEFVKGAEDFFWGVSHRRPVILTAIPVREHPGIDNVAKFVATQKREWARRKLGTSTLVIPAPGVPKSIFMHNPRDILVDDYGKNCAEWTAAGGVGIKHDNWDATHQKLYEEFMR